MLTLFSTSYVFMRYISFSHDLINHLKAKTKDKKETPRGTTETNGNTHKDENANRHSSAVCISGLYSGS